MYQLHNCLLDYGKKIAELKMANQVGHYRKHNPTIKINFLWLIKIMLLIFLITSSLIRKNFKTTMN